MSSDPMYDLMRHCERVNPTSRKLTRDEVRADFALRLAVARVKVQYRARQGNPATERAGIIGVGLITYAEHRLATFDRRVEALT
jgi:hypothetical protein